MSITQDCGLHAAHNTGWRLGKEDGGGGWGKRMGVEAGVEGWGWGMGGGKRMRWRMEGG